MKGRILSRVMMQPVEQADREPRERAAGEARPPGHRAESSAATTLASAATPPTDRSMPPVMMTKHMPSAISANIEL